MRGLSDTPTTAVDLPLLQVKLDTLQLSSQLVSSAGKKWMTTNSQIQSTDKSCLTDTQLMSNFFPVKNLSACTGFQVGNHYGWVWSSWPMTWYSAYICLRCITVWKWENHLCNEQNTCLNQIKSCESYMYLQCDLHVLINYLKSPGITHGEEPGL